MSCFAHTQMAKLQYQKFLATESSAMPQTNFQHFLTFQNAAVCIGLSVYSVLVISSKLKDLLDQPDQFADFTSLADLTKQNNNAIAVCVFFSWIKLSKYISFNKTMTQLSSTLSRVSGKQHFSYH